MTTSYKIPPALDEEILYETWKSEIDIWRLMTDVEKERQALALVLLLSGQARQCALKINVADLNMTDGVDTLLKSLDELFLKDKVDIAYYTRESSSKHKKTYQSNKLNPLNKYGKPSRCVICQSIYHWKKDQVERTNKVNLTEHVE